MERHFEGKQEAKLYKKYRPGTPQAVVEVIMGYLREKQHGPLTSVVDVGCGNGQNTLAFASHFQKVLGTDISSNMISEILSDPSLPSNVSFAISPAEQLPVPDGSVDMVTGAQCFHWFDMEKFHREMDRVLKPDGVVAAVGHDFDYLADPSDESKSEALKIIFAEFQQALSPYFQKALLPLINRYTDLDFPYEDFKRVDVRHDFPISLADYLGLINTYSQVQKWKKENPEAAEAALNKLIQCSMEVLDIKYGTPLESIRTTLRLEIFILLGRKRLLEK